MNKHALPLFSTLVNLFATPYQQENFRALIAGFLRGDGRPTPSRATSKSESALSRFLNNCEWNSRSVINHVRNAAVSSILEYYANKRGRRCRLLVMIDLTTLEKTGKFTLLNLISVLNSKRGLHVVVIYLVAGPLRLPWGFRIWRGKNSTSVSALALALLRTLPAELLQFDPLVLADSGFGTSIFLRGCKKLGFDTVVGMRKNRRLEDGRIITQARSGDSVLLKDLEFPVTVARYHLPRDGKQETRFVVATFTAAGQVIARWGRRRWRIEAFFKTAKSRFGFERFGQSTKQGVYRYLLFSLLAFILTQWQVWEVHWPAWEEAAQATRRQLLPEIIEAELQAEIEKLKPYLQAAKTRSQT